jgi:hypothetical protein
MSYAEFRDANGKSWRVWKTRPRLAEILSILPGDWRDGWLTFECDGETRRLAPIPAGWEEFSPTRLELLRRMAEPIRRSASTETMLRREERIPE